MMRLVLFLLFSVTVIAGDHCADIFAPPNLLVVTKQGCEIKQSDDSRNPTMAGTYRLRVWVEYPNKKRWSILYAVREPGEVEKAMKDCAQWMKCVQKKQRKLLQKKGK
jgi:hypothetical protein